MLSVTLSVKIAATILFWCIPLLLFPSSLLETFGFPPQENMVFLRLLGWAYFALCVGYGFGLQSARRGVRAPGPIWTGIVSNGGACVLLIVFGSSGTWSDWGSLAQAFMWGSALATGLIAAALVTSGVLNLGTPGSREG